MSSPWITTALGGASEPACDDPGCEGSPEGLPLFRLPSGQHLCTRCTTHYVSWLLNSDQRRDWPDAYDWVEGR